VTTRADAQELGLLARLVVAFAVLLVAAGVVWHGITVQTLQRFWRDLAARPGGPMSFRFILQPAMAAIAAFLDGRRDAASGRSPYFWGLVRDRGERLGRLREGLNGTARIILLGIAMDVIYQALVLRTFYPTEALVVALLLAFVPYILLRGPFARAARRWRRRATPPGPS